MIFEAITDPLKLVKGFHLFPDFNDFQNVNFSLNGQSSLSAPK